MHVLQKARLRVNQQPKVWVLLISTNACLEVLTLSHESCNQKHAV